MRAKRIPAMNLKCGDEILDQDRNIVHVHKLVIEKDLIFKNSRQINVSGVYLWYSMEYLPNQPLIQHREHTVTFGIMEYVTLLSRAEEKQSKE